MSTALPPAAATPQPTSLHSSPAFTQQLQQQQIQAQNMFRQRQLMAQRQLQQQPLFQQPQLSQQQQLQQQQQQIHLQQQMDLQQQRAPMQRTLSMQSTSSVQGRMNPSINQGQAVLFLLQFAEQLSPSEEQAVDISFWDNFTSNFFAVQSILKWGLYNIKDNEQKSYEVSQALIARFFLSQYRSGAESIQMTIDKTMEYILPGGLMQVECPHVSIINKYKNGSLVISKGPLWAQFIMKNGSLKISHLEFSCQGHEEYITKRNIKLEPVPTSKKKAPSQQTNIPESPVNDWGLPPLVFHILQIGDTALKASEIMFHSIVSGSTPRDSLGAIALSKQPMPMIKNEIEENSPIVKTQTGGQPPRQQQQASFQFHQQSYLQQPSYTASSPVSRKRNTTDTKSPASKKKK